jgi:hypothetical protein
MMRGSSRYDWRAKRLPERQDVDEAGHGQSKCGSHSLEFSEGVGTGKRRRRRRDTSWVCVYLSRTFK